jgi:hypothetical protein
MTRPFRPIVVNLDALGALFDRVLAHPIAGVVQAAAPELHAALVEAREDLTGVAANLVGRAQDAAIGHLDQAAARAVRKVTGKKKKRAAAPKRLPR